MRSVRARSKPAAKSRRGRGTKQRARPAASRSATAASTKPRTQFRDSRLARLFRSAGASPLIRHPILLLTALLILGGAAAGMYAGGHVSDALAGLRDRAIVAMAGVGFTVDEIRIEGNERTDAADIRAALAIDEGEPIFAIDTAAARERLGRLPWVADAVVRRRFPGLVAVRLIEKRPFAIWEIGSAHVVVERSGAVIEGVAPTAADRLPLLIGPGAPEAAAPLIDSLSVQRAVSARLVAVERISERRWDIILDRGVRVRLPESDWEAQLVELERLIVDRGLLERDLEIIDLRFPDSYIFQLHNGDSQPVSRETPV